MGRKSKQWTDGQLAWLEEQLETAQIKDIYRSKSHPHAEIARRLAPLFQERFGSAATDEQADEHKKNLKEKIRRWIIDRGTTLARRSKSTVNKVVVDVVPTRKKRKVSALDLYQKTHGPRRGNIGQHRQLSKEEFEELSEAERVQYVELVRAVNEEASKALPSLPENGGTSPVRKLASEDIATAVQQFMRWLKDSAGWGGFVYIGGADIDGSLSVYSHIEGKNKHGQSLLDFFCESAQISTTELQALAQLWLEQARATEDHIDSSNPLPRLRELLQEARSVAVR
ncbi:hypothetical protein NUW54_g12802 [Trametes sanguinea]|uniref:Uncharacterized protein n=1 Tax=Trametes sanguinea TaxID=158606 RepID=A0ACC1MV28_9APHY|nr:hypothetical protein NUW54_g12802 [Trametes sanguinea]